MEIVSRRVRHCDEKLVAEADRCTVYALMRSPYVVPMPAGATLFPARSQGILPVQPPWRPGARARYTGRNGQLPELLLHDVYIPRQASQVALELLKRLVTFSELFVARFSIACGSVTRKKYLHGSLEL